jgi:FixJ family two-component response regulator
LESAATRCSAPKPSYSYVDTALRRACPRATLRWVTPQGQAVLHTPALISVIDDDASFRIATDNLLSAHGYTVYSFASAAEFLHSPQLDETSCVISDVQMPAMSGIELQTLLRKQGRGLPFIFITAFPKETVRVRALSEGAIGFLVKPFDGLTLIRCVEAALRTHRDPTGR